MKRLLICVLILFLSWTCFSAENLTIYLGGNYLSPSDDYFKTLYGDTKYFPEGKISLRLYGNIYLWGSFGFLKASYKWNEWSNKGLINPDLRGVSEVDKMIISGGVGYFVGYLRPRELSIKIEAGICNIQNSIETSKKQLSGETVAYIERKESGIGFRGNFGVTYGLLKHLYSEVSIGVLWASDKIGDDNIKLGGFQASLGLGLVF